MKKSDYSEKLKNSVLTLRVFSQNFDKARKEDIPQNALKFLCVTGKVFLLWSSAEVTKRNLNSSLNSKDTHFILAASSCYTCDRSGDLNLPKLISAKKKQEKKIMGVASRVASQLKALEIRKYQEK